MAVQLFKEGETPIYVEPNELTNLLAVGWLLEDPTAEKKLPAGVEILNPKEEAKAAGVNQFMTKGGAQPDRVEASAPPKVRKKPGRKAKAK